MYSGCHLFERVHAILEIDFERYFWGDDSYGNGDFDSCHKGDMMDLLWMVGEEESTREIFFKKKDSRLHRWRG